MCRNDPHTHVGINYPNLWSISANSKNKKATGRKEDRKTKQKQVVCGLVLQDNTSEQQILKNRNNRRWLMYKSCTINIFPGQIAIIPLNFVKYSKKTVKNTASHHNNHNKTYNNNHYRSNSSFTEKILLIISLSFL